jgi:hypothetical protein
MKRKSNKGKAGPTQSLTIRGAVLRTRARIAQLRTGKPTCECGFKVRGDKDLHKAGKHHKMRHPSLRSQPVLGVLP